MATPKQIASIKAYALHRYEKGWDIVVECMDDAELADLIDQQGGVRAALSELRAEVRMNLEQRSNCRFE